MKKIALCVAALLVGTSCFAAASHINSSHAGKLGALGASFKKYGSDTIKSHEDRVNMVYGGEDVSRLPLLAMHAVS